MCRNIRVLHHFEPPTTVEEVHAAALQYVRKVGGISSSRPSRADEAAVARAVEEVAAATERLLAALTVRGEARTRERERELAKLKWSKRQARLIER